MAKIIIIGAGISGLSSYLFLRKHLPLSDPALSPQEGRYEIKIYEAYDIHQSNFGASLTNPPTGDNAHESTINALPANETEPIFTPQAIGSAIGISRNGLNVLARLDDDRQDHHKDARVARSSLIEEMAVRGHPIERWEISTARGFTLVEVNLARTAARPNPDKHVQSKAPTPAEQAPCPYHGIMIARQSCWEMLRDRVLRDAPDVVLRKKVVDVTIGDEKARNVVKFEDGSEEEADLVIGADGLRSVLRRAIFSEGEANAGVQNRNEQPARPTREVTSSWLRTILSYLLISVFNFGRAAPAKVTQRDYISPHYEGLVGVGGFVPSSVLQATGHKPSTMTIVFGPNGFFGYGYLTSSTPAPGPPNSASDDDTVTGNTDTNPTLAVPAPGPLAGWWSTFSSPTPFPYSTSASPSESESASASPSPGAGAPNNTNGDTRASTNGKATATATRKPTDFNKPLALAALRSRHAKWRNPSIQAILSFVGQDTEQQQHHYQHDSHLLNGKALDAVYPTWTTPELPYWSVRGRAVLVGDAAHALQPSSGQGACQAFEDAEALALFLRHYLSGPSSRSGASSPSAPGATTATTATATATATASAPPPPPAASGSTLHAGLTCALHAFETLRKPRVHAIYTRSQHMSRMKADMGVVAEWTMYLAIYIMTWFRDSYNDELFGYDLPREVERVLLEREKQRDGR